MTRNIIPRPNMQIYQLDRSLVLKGCLVGREISKGQRQGKGRLCWVCQG